MEHFGGKKVYSGFWKYGYYSGQGNGYDGAIYTLKLFYTVAAKYGMLIDWDNHFLADDEKTIVFPLVVGGTLYFTVRGVTPVLSLVEVNAILDASYAVSEYDWEQCMDAFCKVIQSNGMYRPSSESGVSASPKSADMSVISELMRLRPDRTVPTPGQRNPASDTNAWRCSCGRVNPGYVGTCNCGITKSEAASGMRRSNNQRIIRGSNDINSHRRLNDPPRQTKRDQITATNSQVSATQDKLRRLRECQEQFDKGMITKAQYEARKTSILREP